MSAGDLICNGVLQRRRPQACVTFFRLTFCVAWADYNADGPVDDRRRSAPTGAARLMPRVFSLALIGHDQGGLV
jgi:hypothetical protein